MTQVGQGDEAIHVEEQGAGAPLLLVPGLGGTAVSWGAQTARLAAGYRVILHDHRGAGRSARPLMTYSVEQMAGDVLRVMDACGVERAHVVGHSMGGAIGQVLAIEHPDRLASLVISCSWTHCDPYIGRLFRFRRDFLERCGVDLYARMFPLMMFPPDWIAARDAEIDARVRDMAAGFGDPAIGIARIDALLRFDRRDRLGQIKAPTLVIGCADDIVTPAYFSRELARRIPGARLAMLSRGGHFVHTTEPEAWGAAVLAFLSGSGGPAPHS